MTGLMLEGFLNADMVMFSSTDFVFIFLPIFLCLYYVMSPRYRNGILFLGSLIFYGAGSLPYVALLLFAVLVNCLAAKGIEKHRVSRWRLGVILFLDGGLLALFKVLHGWDNNILMPLGVSFFIFKMISFQMDIYRGRIENPSLMQAAVYFIMFPQIVSGPIARFSEMQPALVQRSYDMERFEEGIKLFVLGLAGKVLLADRLALLWNDIQSIGFESISTPLAWFGAAAYSLQLYFDFAGYSMMAGGICVMLGFPFIQNFDHPYASASIREFFKRWHITLGTWFRDYLYIPLGGSRASKPKWIKNLLLVWLITGIWHGGTLNFIIWGMVLFLIILCEKLFFGKLLERFPILGHCYVMAVMPLTWMFFAIERLSDIGVYFSRLFPFFGVGRTVNQGDIVKYAKNYWIFFAAAIICCIPAVYRKYEQHKKNPLVIAGLLALFWLCVYAMSNAVNNPFLYSDF